VFSRNTQLRGNVIVLIDAPLSVVTADLTVLPTQLGSPTR